MTAHRRSDIGRDLPSDLGDREREEILGIATRLEEDSPAPSLFFRSDLRRRLLDAGQAERGLVPLKIGAGSLAASCFATGLLLLVVSAVGLAGIGPFAAS